MRVTPSGETASRSHHVRRHLENPPNFRPLFFRIEKMMRKYPLLPSGETASRCDYCSDSIADFREADRGNRVSAQI